MAGNKEEAKPELIVDQENDLQALFDSVLKPECKRALQVPWNMRNMPDSFFIPPSTGSKSIHSRDSSVDSAFGGTVPSRTVHHRAHSSPASLQQTYAVGHQQQPHMKQRSYDVGSLNDDLTPLPYGWEQARTTQGQVYYLNHTTKTTTWEDPRKTLAAQAATAHHQPPAHQSPHSTSKIPPEVGLGPLPDGWEQAQTKEGQVYFLNHHTGTTSWFDPRIPPHLQQRSSNKLIGLAQRGDGANQAQQDRLHLLHLEREKLKQRQQEIRRQDPSSLTTYHYRQESADSGLGMGNTYSLPPNNSEDMDDTMDLVSTLQLAEEFPILDKILGEVLCAELDNSSPST